MKQQRPVTFIASPYTSGDPAINTHFQCKVFDQLLGDRKVTPVAPLWSHFQHTLFPRPYKDWIEYDLELIRLYDCCLRLEVDFPAAGYHQSDSRGADGEVAAFEAAGKPVFYSIDALYRWVDEEFAEK